MGRTWVLAGLSGLNGLMWSLLLGWWGLLISLPSAIGIGLVMGGTYERDL